jgi:hypothetical protein
VRFLLLLMVAVMLPAQSLEDARMARGDDPRWADPAFDDRDWETVGRRRIRPMEDAKENRFWLRITVTVPAREPAAVAVIHCPCEVFLDGVRLGATGELNAPRPKTTSDLTVFPVPAALAGRSVVLATRLYHPPGREAGSGPLSSVRIRLLAVREMGVAAQIQDDSEFPFVVRFTFLLLALGGLLAAALGQRNDPLILGMLCHVCPSLASMVIILLAPMNEADNYAWLYVVLIPAYPALVLVQWQLAGLPLRRAWGAAALAGYLVFRTPWVAGLFLAKPAPWTPLVASVFMVPHVMTFGMATYAAARGWGRSSRLVRFLMAAVVTALALHIIGRLARQGWIPGLLVGAEAVMSLFITTFATTYIIRTGRERRAEQERLRGEMESAQTVQALLLNQTMPAEVEAVYLPASEVGGDFYQVLEVADGARLVMVGDVSGKGLKAAMLVAVVVGAVGSTKSSAPAAVLARVNRALMGRAGGGFATACCARFDRDGTVTMANAGHLPPYCDGREFERAPGLPLGIMADAEYAETVVPGERFTFLSDGVVEAENAQRELFGFDRTRAISTQSAQEIAEAAKAWGQTDDITVVTVRRRVA